MPTILLLGSAGYVALPLALSLLRTGNHTVIGLVRREEQAKLLLQNEIKPVVADAGDIAAWTKVIEDEHVDVVVDCSSGYEHAGAILEGVVGIAVKRQQILEAEGFGQVAKLGFVYVSGTWVHGSPSSRVSSTHTIGTTQSLGTPVSMTSWRAQHEQAILSSRHDLDVAIVRPAMVYGRSGWVWDTWWTPILAVRGKPWEKISIPAGREARPSVVHVDDVVAGLHAVVDRIEGRLGSWPVFDFVGEHVGIEAIVEAVKEAVGVKNEVEYTGTQGNVFYEALAVRANVDAGRATTVLGWQPKVRDFLLKMGVYVKAFEAAKEAK